MLGAPQAVPAEFDYVALVAATPRPLVDCRRLLVAVPNWVGDVVLATPILAAIRKHFSAVHVAFLLRPYVAEIVEGGGWHDQLIPWPRGGGVSSLAALRDLSRSLRRDHFDAALLFTNSFRSALAVRMAGIPRRIGYARELRAFLLTDRLRPLRRGGQFVPMPMLDYYCAIAEHVGCPVTDRRLRLGVTPEQEAAAATLARQYRLQAGAYSIINPGAAFGASKCWPPERFAEVCDLLFERGLPGVLVGAPGEKPLMREIARLARRPVTCCDEPGTTLGSLKALVRDAALLVCNDTGPRHYGNAFGVPTVTIFGPTHQEWTDTGYSGEIKLQASVDCGPCQLKRCPLDHRCMTAISPGEVITAAERLLAERGRKSAMGTGVD